MLKLCGTWLLALSVAGCGTLTGIPGHGGGKRFSEEQRLVASSIRLALDQIDVTSLRRKRVAIVFGLIADEGGGNIVGGRASVTAVFTQGQVVVPTSNSRSSVDIFQVATSGSSAVTTATTGSSTATGTNTASGTSATTGSTNQTNTSTSTQTGSGTSDATSTSTTDGTSSTDTTAVSVGGTTQTTTTDADTTSNSTTNTTQNGTSTNTATTSTNGTATNTNTSNTTTNNTTNVNNTGTNTSDTTQSGSSTETTGQPIVTGQTTEQSGRSSNIEIGAEYGGLGQYQNLAVPKSDAAFLMSEVRNKLLLSGVTVTVPEDPSVDAILYVSVPILGTNRQRTDLVLYNNEKLRAEAYIEMFAINRAGRVIMQRQVGNMETYYSEDYVLWSGPYDTQRGAEQGAGLIGGVR